MTTAIAAHAPGGDWPQMRGPHGTGATEAHDLPVELGPQTNVRWEVALPGHSAATPAVSGDNIFVCTPAGQDLLLVCLDRQGKERWSRNLGTGNRKLGFNGKNNFASSSPVTDGEHVWQLIGTGDLACFDMNGELVWTVNLNDSLGRYRTLFGIGFTPLLYHDTLYVPYLHQGESLIAALDKQTGAIKWKTPRVTSAEDESKDAYSSPCVFEYADRAEIVICGADLANAYDAETGQETWRHGDINPKGNRTLRIVVSPVADGERIYVSSAKGGPFYSIKPGGQGDVTSTHRLWSCLENTPDVPTPAVADGLLYLLRETGVMTVLDAATGEVCYSQRVADRTGAFSPSPLVADGKVYLANESGLVVVLKAGREFEKLAHNELGELIMATPVAVDDCLLVRTEGRLYCFAKPK
ncbi:MAG: PQQ-binding-like beta-propeller repeat protein [Pirellulales bacterium]